MCLCVCQGGGDSYPPPTDLPDYPPPTTVDVPPVPDDAVVPSVPVANQPVVLDFAGEPLNRLGESSHLHHQLIKN